MIVLKTIDDEDVGWKNEYPIEKLKERKASRAVLIKRDMVAMLYVAKHEYHKLPGGGLEPGENRGQALSREVLEETGCEARIIDEIGQINEVRREHGIRQTSYCYLAQVTKDTKAPTFTLEEAGQGFSLVWVPISKAIDLMEKDTPKNYEGAFIRKRDSLFLKMGLEKHMDGRSSQNKK